MTNREIKFRALIDGEMYYQDSNTASAMNGLELFAAKVGSAKGHTPPVMQATGLKDSAGVEVYEGDILSYKSDKKAEGGGYIAGTRGYHLENSQEVFWENGRFYLGNYLDLATTLSFWEEWGGLQVVGNIYQHPNLRNNQSKL